MGDGKVIAVARSAKHSFSKIPVASIEVVAGEGVLGDAHRGVTIKHRSRVAKDPSQPNLRQVYLLQSELFDELAGQGFKIAPSDIGENITTRDIDLLSLPQDTLLQIDRAVLRVTGLRNPCAQLNEFRPGLMNAVLGKAADGRLIRKAGIMTVVEEGGAISAGNSIDVQLPEQPHLPLQVV